METIEMLKNNSDPVASANEKIDVQSAKTIADLGKVMVEGYKVKANVLNIISRSDTLSKELTLAASSGGFIQEPEAKILTE